MACVIGDGESETGPLAGSWHSNKFLNPVTDGAVLPILHLNGYKIANPTVPARIPPDELEALLTGYGYHVYTVEGDDPKLVHEQLAGTLDAIVTEIHDIQRRARAEGDTERPRWPALVLRTPKGWTGPKFVDGKPVEGTWRAHQVPIAEARGNAEHLRQLEEWMRSYRPEELFDAVRRAAAGDRRARPGGLPADERQPARQRRAAAARPGPAALPGLRGRRAVARRGGRGEHPRARRLAAGHHHSATARRSGCSARTRRRRTGSTRSSR